MDSSSENVDPTATYWVHKWNYLAMPFEIAVITSVFSALFGILGGFANSLVLYLIFQIRRIQDRDNLDILVLSLCFSDFLSSVVVQPVLIPRLLAQSRVSEFHSLLIHTSTHFTLVLGSLSLLSITFSRYLSIKFPFSYANHVTETKICVCLLTVFSAAVGMVVWIFIDGQSESATFPIIISVIVALTIFFQINIFMIIYAQNRYMRRQIMAVEYNRGQSETSYMTRRTNAQRSKTNKTILYICAVFIITWLPSIIFRVDYVFHGNLTFYIQWLHLFNVIIQIHSCINPWLYVLRTSRIKIFFMRIYYRE